MEFDEFSSSMFLKFARYHYMLSPSFAYQNGQEEEECLFKENYSLAHIVRSFLKIKIKKAKMGLQNRQDAIDSNISN
jgi:hypothetical protein